MVSSVATFLVLGKTYHHSTCFDSANKKLQGCKRHAGLAGLLRAADIFRKTPQPFFLSDSIFAKHSHRPPKVPNVATCLVLGKTYHDR